MILILITNLVIASFAWTAFTTVSVNRFSFRFIYILTLLSAFQVSIYLFSYWTGNENLNPVRYFIFTLQEILMFAMLIRPFRNRKMELVIRTGFYFLLIMTTAYWNLWFDLIKIGLLFGLAATHSKLIFKKWMMAVMGAFMVSYVMFYMFGLDSIYFNLAGLLYVVVFLFATTSLYKADEVELKMFRRIMDDIVNSEGGRNEGVKKTKD